MFPKIILLSDDQKYNYEFRPMIQAFLIYGHIQTKTDTHTHIDANTQRHTPTLTQTQTQTHTHTHRVNSRLVMTNVIDCNTFVTEFELQSGNCVHFLANTIEKI